MNKSIDINREDIFDHLKISCQLPTILEGVITCKVIEHKAAEIGITVNTEDIQQAADNFRLTQRLRNIQDTHAWLQKHHLSLDDFERLIHTNIVSRKLVEHLFGDRVEAWFYQHQLDYAGAAIYEVFLDDQDIAMELYCALREGEISFHEIARQYIAEPSLRRSGGYRGIVSRKELKSQVSRAVFAANPPEFLKPIITTTGIHVILVEEIIQPKLDEQIRKQILGDLFSQWLKQQTEKLEIRINLDLKTPLSFNSKVLT
jgi:parvulin-like peptidyl-prolyl isomerase